MGCRPSKSGNAAFLRPCTLETGSDYVAQAKIPAKGESARRWKPQDSAKAAKIPAKKIRM